jgi:hypothetical protein
MMTQLTQTRIDGLLVVHAPTTDGLQLGSSSICDEASVGAWSTDAEHSTLVRHHYILM